jgi:hypothetical protein
MLINCASENLTKQEFRLLGRGKLFPDAVQCPITDVIRSGQKTNHLCYWATLHIC